MRRRSPPERSHWHALGGPPFKLPLPVTPPGPPPTGSRSCQSDGLAEAVVVAAVVDRHSRRVVQLRVLCVVQLRLRLLCVVQLHVLSPCVVQFSRAVWRQCNLNFAGSGLPT